MLPPSNRIKIKEQSTAVDKSSDINFKNLISYLIQSQKYNFKCGANLQITMNNVKLTMNNGQLTINS